MREYKVLFVDDKRGYICYDEERLETERMNRREQEALLNQLAKEGWKLIQTASRGEYEFYLYMEREL